MHVLEELHCKAWNHSFLQETQAHIIHSLEKGQIIYCPELAFKLLPHEEKFLSPLCSNTNAKNISYNASTQVLSGSTCQGKEYEALKTMIQRFSQSACQLIYRLFPRYQNSLKIGRTSYRPVEIAGRQTSYRKDDTRLHVDAFPSAPNQGWRILRVFSNINPAGQGRLWRIGEPFVDIAHKFLPRVKNPWFGSSAFLKLMKITKTYRTLYDHIMLQIHNHMKADQHYQTVSPQVSFSFPPETSWIVQSDHVSHAAMSGQYVLEQTFYLPVAAMQQPHLSPLKILENLTGRHLVTVKDKS